MNIPAIGFLMLLFITCTSGSAQTITTYSDDSALMAFKSHLMLEKGHLLLRNWSSNTHFCNWYGVSCLNGRVTVLQLSGLGLQGTISSDIGNLTELVEIDLSRNGLGGSLPSELGFLQHLRHFSIRGNDFTGSIPGSIFNVSSLETVDMSINAFSGTLPDDMGMTLPNLESLNLDGNRISGTIPVSIANSTKLTFLRLNENDLEGEIPSEFGKLKNMLWFEFEYNRISGNIPESIYNISSLEILEARHNYLKGSLPSDLGQWLPNLQKLFLSHNQFSGEIPSTICNATKLVYLELANNSFSGSVPRMLGNLLDLQHLVLETNSLVNEPHAKYLHFLDSLVNCKSLEYLILYANPLNGILPETVGNLSVNLKVFAAAICMIKGKIPEGIGNLNSLNLLDLGDNNLEGNIPSSFARLHRIERIYLDGNMLTGTVPDDLGSLTKLGVLNIGENKFTGDLPLPIGNLTNLIELYLGGNSFSSQVPLSYWGLVKLEALNLSMNVLQGTLDPKVGNLKAIVMMDISSNNFSGELPNSIGNLQSLISLYVSYNSFDGPIPSVLSNLIVLEDLDLSSNSLSGEIPTSLELLKDLSFLDISYNRLQGPLPHRGVFANLSNLFIVGNSGLCGSPNLNLPPCKRVTQSFPINRKSNPILLKITVPLGFIFLLVVLTILIIIRRKKRGSSKNVAADSSPSNGHQIITYYELIRATDHFSELNLIGRGNSGTVYKGTLSDGTVVAIKVFNMLNEKIMKTFDVECEVLSKVRHRNLVRIISTCSNNIDFKAMILQFMPNGSLDEWLHIKYLTLKQRVNILIDTAQAVAYLHHDYTTTILHCDLKPSNILLDDDMTAHVADFGISKIFDQDQQVAHTKTLGTIGYIAPEYGVHGQITTKNDVYSYGILLLETFTRKRPTDSLFKEDLNLQKWVSRSLPGALMEVLDTQLCNEIHHMRDAHAKIDNQIDKLLVTTIKVGLLCLKESPEERITMREVVVQLKNIQSEIHKIYSNF